MHVVSNFKYAFFAFVVFLSFGNTHSQTRKKVEAYKITTPLVIDGKLDEAAYSSAIPAKDFVQLQPYNGKPSPQPSEVYFFYDQTAVYVGAKLYDCHPDSIFNYLTERDNTGMSDYFGVYLDPYNQGQLAYGFFISPAGIQVDIKAVKSESDNEDSNWNAVWESKTSINKDGWTVEMKIPYSALRFSEKAGSDWGLNMFRNIRRYNSNNSWNFIDRKISGFIHQEGILSGIKDIKPPVRLSFSPYIASYFEPKSSNGTSKFLYKGGLDLKYGINDAFTLDMMLIPDFGQIQSDDKKLNLTPYETFYDEKRQFFTEGTELFQRGGVFYSRRIGSSPKFSADNSLKNNEIIDYNPTETQLVNATKVSGRTDKGWGIGMLNAMTLASNAIVKNSETGDSRKVEVQPFTNYNVTVVDKSLKNNSYISLINTNVSMLNNPFHANVTATEFQFRDKTKTYALKGKGGVSFRGDSVSETGFFSTLGFEKNQGKLLWGISQNIYSDKYNPTDLGYLQHNNQVQTQAYIYYQIIDPFWIIRECNGDIWLNYNRMYNPNTLFDKELGYECMVRFTNNYLFYSDGRITTDQFDYYEPRVKGKYYLNPKRRLINLNLNTDQRKDLNFSFHYGLVNQPTIGRIEHDFDAYANYRVGKQLEFNYGISSMNSKNEEGFTDYVSSGDSIIFANRNVTTLVNTLSTSYILTNNASLSLRARHYWSGVANNKYYLLQPDGSLANNAGYVQIKDQNYNAFTIDIIFRWIFAPGSELSMAWKTTSYSDDNSVNYNYGSNLEKSWLNQNNSLSLKVLYYIDYNNLFKNANKK
ncbi:MAG: DUF5916 domain-containing protein [Paludibacter sp.]